jgi:hypothetical protein
MDLNINVVRNQSQDLIMAEDDLPMLMLGLDDVPKAEATLPKRSETLGTATRSSAAHKTSVCVLQVA